MVSKKNLFIAVEGIDGSGKSTIANKIAEELKNVTLCSCPPEQIRFLKEMVNQAPPEIRYKYFRLGNDIAGKEIEGMLESSHVICVRYIHSTAAYHSVLLERELEVPEGILRPDFIIHTNADLRVIDQRLSERGDKRTEYESIDFLGRVEQEYFRLFLGKYNVIGANTTKARPCDTAKRIIKEIGLSQ